MRPSGSGDGLAPGGTIVAYIVLERAGWSDESTVGSDEGRQRRAGGRMRGRTPRDDDGRPKSDL